MIATPFDYRLATSVEEAVRLLAGSPDAKILAGGHSLLPLMKLGLAQPSLLVDIGRIAALRGVQQNGEITIGALTTHQAIADDATCRARLTALSEAAASVGDVQVRGRGTIGGSLAHADPGGDEQACVLAFDATLRAVGPKGDRAIAAKDFFKGALETALGVGEILISVRFPAPPPRTGSAYAKVAHPASGFAVVGVAVVVTVAKDGTIERAAIGVTGAADRPFRATAAERALAGTNGDDAAIAAAAAKVGEGARLSSDLAASAEFRGPLLTVHTQRALRRAMEAAKG
ncbi:MAG TPA: xanthine dehydrogenase family protein subunit M [Candidatus Limnocylindria bacterium]|nr:xanthine dehydrogenase family protein subunit M [Candidatus Limnocylindria bacterium]